MSDMKNTFYTVCKAGLLSKMENGSKCMFLEGGFCSWNEQQTFLKFCSGRKIDQEQCNRWNIFASSPLTGSWPSRLSIATTIFWCSGTLTNHHLQSRFPTPLFYFNLQIPPSSELWKKHLACLNLFCIFTAKLRLAPSLGQATEFLSSTRNAWAHVNSFQCLWNCVWSSLSDVKPMLEPRTSAYVL